MVVPAGSGRFHRQQRDWQVPEQGDAMKATWKHQKNMNSTVAFVLALLFGGSVSPERLNPNEPADLTALSADSLHLVVEQGRRQLDAQSERFRHVTDRAQTLLTVSLVALAFVAGTLSRINNTHGSQRIVATTVWAVGLLLVLLGIATAAAVIVVRAPFSAVDTTQMTTWSEPVLTQLATDHAKSVILGETTVAARVTLFRQATRFVSWGAVLATATYVIAS
ncbi:MAG: hypothetical protein ACXVFI_19245 [Solirubrobacteraceae bacterium]